jgi:hypothetical protein
MLPRDAPPACCIALLLLSTRGWQRANAVDLVSQGRPPSARCGCQVEPAVLAAGELVGDAPGAERIEPNNPAGRMLELLWNSKPPCDRGGQQHARRDEAAHMFGHVLGKHHVDSPGREPLAPVMVQQTKGLGACRKNPGRTRLRLRSTSLALFEARAPATRDCPRQLLTWKLRTDALATTSAPRQETRWCGVRRCSARDSGSRVPARLARSPGLCR